MSFWRGELLKVIAQLKILQPLASFAANPSSANLRSLLTDETGTGAAVFANAPTITGVPVFSGIPSLTGGALSFPATQVPSAGANDLDDYEEGTFTPAFSASGATFSYALQNGQYVKIGNIVHFFIALTLNTSGNTLTANALTITGLPFAANANTGGDFPIRWGNSTTSYIDLLARTSGGSTGLILEGNTAAGTSNTTVVVCNGALHATNGSTMRISGFYFV